MDLLLQYITSHDIDNAKNLFKVNSREELQDVLQCYIHDWTALHVAVIASSKYYSKSNNGNKALVDIIQLLIQGGANINAKTSHFRVYNNVWFVPSHSTPLHIAVEYNLDPTIEYLLIASGALVNEIDACKLKPLDIAVQRLTGSPSYVKQDLSVITEAYLQKIHLLLAAGATFGSAVKHSHLLSSRCKMEFFLRIVNHPIHGLIRYGGRVINLYYPVMLMTVSVTEHLKDTMYKIQEWRYLRNLIAVF